MLLHLVNFIQPPFTNWLLFDQDPGGVNVERDFGLNQSLVSPKVDWRLIVARGGRAIRWGSIPVDPGWLTAAAKARQHL